MAAQRVLLPYEQTGYHSPMRILIICYMQGEICDEDLSYDYALKNYGRTEFGPFFQKGQEMGQFRAGECEQMGDFFWHLIIGYAMHKVSPGQELVDEQTIEEMLSLFRP